MAIPNAAQIGEALTKTKMICKENVTVSQMTVKELVDNGHCASYYLQSEPSKSQFNNYHFLKSVFKRLGYICRWNYLLL